jgi:putative transposase
MNTALEIAPEIGIVAACSGLGVARATFYRAQRPVSVRQSRAPRPASPRALSVSEQHTILEVLHEPAYVDSSPRTVFAMLLDADRYRLGVYLLPAFARLGGDPQAAR